MGIMGNHFLDLNPQVQIVYLIIFNNFNLGLPALLCCYRQNNAKTILESKLEKKNPYFFIYYSLRFKIIFILKKVNTLNMKNPTIYCAKRLTDIKNYAITSYAANSNSTKGRPLS